MAIHPSGIIFSVGLIGLVYHFYRLQKDNKDNWELFIGSIALLTVGYLSYVYAFLSDDFVLIDVLSSSSSTLSPALKFSASWASSGGSLLLWCILLGVFALVHRWKMKLSDVKNISLFKIYDLLLIAVGVITFANRPFDTLDIPQGSQPPVNGFGLNPILKSLWMQIHPPITFIGYTLALYGAILYFMDRELRLHDRLASLAWIFITMANLMGGLWAYSTLGWGGYWAWDPVETGLLLPWLSLTAYFHAKVVSRKLQDLFMACTGFMVPFATFVTRSGLLSSLHAFSISWEGALPIIIGIPFIPLIIKGLGESYREAEELIGKYNVYEWSMFLSAISIGAILLMCFAGLFIPVVMNMMGYQIVLGPEYFNIASTPWVALFLISMIGCSLRKYSITWRQYGLILFPLFISSLVLLYMTFSGIFTWSNFSPILTNAIISFMIPLTIGSLLISAFGLFASISSGPISDIMIRILHVTIPITLLGILLSGPFAYSQQAFQTIVIKNGETVDIEGVSISYNGAIEYGFNGLVVSPNVGLPMPAELPEELVVNVKLRTSNSIIVVPSRFNLVSLLINRGGFIFEPVVLSEGLDEIYIIMQPETYEDYYHLYSWNFNKSMSIHCFACRHVIAILGFIAGFNNLTEYSQLLTNWSPDNMTLKDHVTLKVKRVPFVKLVWIGASLMIIAEVLYFLSKFRWRNKS